MEIDGNTNRELRVVNRDFSLGEYGESWTKLERYLFIEIYNVIKDFYISSSDENIKSFSSESILLTLPINLLDKCLFKASQRNRDLMTAAEGLSRKQINLKTIDDNGQWSFHFISMFPEISYDPANDKNKMLVRIPRSIYEDMVPIESYCLLDLKLLSEFNSGNTVRLYEIFKSYAFRRSITLSFDGLRKKLGFYKEGSYQEWKYFNAQVLKPSVNDINMHKEYDIEVLYKKKRGAEDIEFTIITHKKHNHGAIKILNLNELISDRTPNLIQAKYIQTLLKYCNEELGDALHIEELTDWVISDLINLQSKNGSDFDFKYSMNAISKQIVDSVYRRPYSHRHLAVDVEKVVFKDEIYQAIKKLEMKSDFKEIRNKFSDEEITVHQFAYILDIA